MRRWMASPELRPASRAVAMRRPRRCEANGRPSCAQAKPKAVTRSTFEDAAVWPRRDQMAAVTRLQ